MNVLYVSTNALVFNGASKCYIDVLKGLVNKNVNVISAVNGKGDLTQIISKYASKVYEMNECIWVWEANKDFKIRGTGKLKYFIRRLQNQLIVNQYIKIIKDNNIDVVYINALTEYCAAVAAKRTNTPLVWHIREILEDGLQARLINKKYSINLLEYSKVQICISQALEQAYINRYGLTKTKVVYDGVDIERFYFEKNILESDKIKIYIFGRVEEIKGQLVLLKAIRELKQIFKNLDCKIIGLANKNKYSQRLTDYINNNNLNDIVSFTGYVNNPESYMRDADISCVCSDAEGFGLVTIESMLSGALVIGSDSGCTTELLDHSEYGLLYEKRNHTDLYNKIKYAIENKEIANELAKNGQKKAKEYTAQRNVDEILKVLINSAE